MRATTSTNLRLSVMRLLASQQEAALSVAADIAAAGQWPQVIELCRQWKVLSTLEALLGKLGTCLPPSDRAGLARQAAQAFVRSNLSMHAGVLALTALEQGGIRCAGFKGIAAIASIYPGVRGRILQDVDILIHPKDVRPAFKILEAHGYCRSFPGDINEYLSFIRNAPGAVGNEAMSFTHTTGGTIDLHWRLGTIDTEVLLSRVTRVGVLNHAIPLLGPGHCLLLCVHHALRNDFVPDDIARDVLDFSKWLAYIEENGAWKDLQPEIERWGLMQSCLALDAIASHLRGVPGFAPLAAAAAPSDLRSAARIVDLYLHQLQSGPLNTDLAYLASQTPWVQVASGLATDWRQYRSHMKKFEALNGEASLTLASRARRFLGSAIHVSPTRWLQLRALSRAKDRVARAEAAPHRQLL